MTELRDLLEQRMIAPSGSQASVRPPAASAPAVGARARRWPDLAGPDLAGTAWPADSDDDAIIIRPQARERFHRILFLHAPRRHAEVEVAIAAACPRRSPTTSSSPACLLVRRLALRPHRGDGSPIPDRRYHVTLLQDGRVAEERTTDHVEEVRQWVSVFSGSLFSTRELEEHTTYDVRVRGRTSPRHTWSFWPWARPSAHGSAGFTFLP
jgi:hypothetical protein